MTQVLQLPCAWHKYLSIKKNEKSGGMEIT